ncbi:hypothetical protein IE4872_PC00022 (plasmid) [Rhizobium gallicum]|uniref:Uncharacterized protein n=1 Tax=Rhizobium gallicum TaxID=56730 RepID=A0A1L5NQ66_9HYPH|nr:hypothetical protein IE4872_PC00022 [Rhizobium gallicum]
MMQSEREWRTQKNMMPTLSSATWSRQLLLDSDGGATGHGETELSIAVKPASISPGACNNRCAAQRAGRDQVPSPSAMSPAGGGRSHSR